MTPRTILIATESTRGPAAEAVSELSAAITARGIHCETWCHEIDGDSPDLDGVDRIVVLGGDGAMMGILRALDFPEIPLYGVNYGRVGFLMNPRLPADELAAMLAEGPTIEQVFPVLAADLHLHSGEAIVDRAVNDFVLERASGQTVHLRTYIDGVLLNLYSGDGLVIATPGGSTAYSLAAGGPVVHQSVPGMLITPLYAHRPVQFHSLQFPILLPLSSRIRVEAEDLEKRPIRFVADGATIEGVQTIEIHDSGRPVRLLRPADYGFIDTLVNKIIGRHPASVRGETNRSATIEGPRGGS